MRSTHRTPPVAALPDLAYDWQAAGAFSVHDAVTAAFSIQGRVDKAQAQKIDDTFSSLGFDIRHRYTEPRFLNPRESFLLPRWNETVKENVIEPLTGVYLPSFMCEVVRENRGVVPDCAYHAAHVMLAEQPGDADRLLGLTLNSLSGLRTSARTLATVRLTQMCDALYPARLIESIGKVFGGYMFTVRGSLAQVRSHWLAHYPQYCATFIAYGGYYRHGDQWLLLADNGDVAYAEYNTIGGTDAQQAALAAFSGEVFAYYRLRKLKLLLPSPEQAEDI